jgi:hypothetical protein
VQGWRPAQAPARGLCASLAGFELAQPVQDGVEVLLDAVELRGRRRRRSRCASRSAAILYGKEPDPGLVLARSQCFVT